MKQISRIFVIFIFLFTLVAGLAPSSVTADSGQRGIAVFVDGLSVSFDVSPLIEEGRTLVPFRALAEALGVTVNWNPETQTITAAKGTNLINLKTDDPLGYLNNSPVHLDVPPRIVNNRTLVPLRFFSETLGYTTAWNQEMQRIDIASPATPLRLIGFYALGDSKTSSWRGLFINDYPIAGSGHTGLVSDVALGWFSLDMQGNLLTKSKTGWQRPDGWENVLDACNKYQVKTAMVVHMTDKDSEIARLLQQPEAVKNAVNGICAEAVKYAGVNLDFEGLGWNENGAQLQQTRDNFSNFVRLLATQLKTTNSELSLSLHAPNSAYQGYDYQVLGTLCDYLNVMAYDYGPKPEPIDRISAAIETALTQVPPEKLVLGISAPNENPDSLKMKIALAKRYKLQGIALWRLGLITDEMWFKIGESITKASL